jgi:hypothetical protein
MKLLIMIFLQAFPLEVSAGQTVCLVFFGVSDVWGQRKWSVSRSLQRLRFFFYQKVHVSLDMK